MRILLLITVLWWNTSVFCQESCDAYQIAQSQIKHQPKKFIQSIEKLMNHFYENKNAAKLPPYELLKHGELAGYDHIYNSESKGNNSFVVDLLQAQKSQYYINCSGKNKPALCQTPPSYVWGGMGWYESKNNLDGTKYLSLDLHANNELTMKLSRHPGLDCSGFSYATYSNFGLRVTKNLDLRPSFETADKTMARTYLDPTMATCFTPVETSSSLQPGDIMAWKKHMAIIASVGKDPFGINHIKNPKDCILENIRPENSTMTIFNSKGAIDSLADYDEKTYDKNPYIKKTLKFLKQRPKLLTGVGIGISKMTFKEFFFIYPYVMADLVKSWCEKKNQADLPTIKILRHVALDENIEHPACQCFALQDNKVKLL